MKKWMLISTWNREFNLPKFFDTWKEAHMEMCKQVGDVIGMSKDEVMETYLSGIEIDEYAGVSDTYAWCDRHENDDWQIFLYDTDALTCKYSIPEERSKQ